MEIMKPFRNRIDELDDKIVDLLAARTDIIREVGQFKFENNIPAVLPSRIDEVKERVAARAENKEFNADLIRQIYSTLIGYSCNLEEEILQNLSEENKTAAGQ